MSDNWIKDIAEMHEHFGVNKAVNNMSVQSLVQYFDFRVKFLQEELDELKNAEIPADAIDALIDLCVVAIGTLDAFGIDGNDAWNRVHAANMKKQVGVKNSRPNPLGLPDLIKPEGWTPPDHDNMRSLLDQVFVEKIIGPNRT
jgi:hypothetical protein